MNNKSLTCLKAGLLLIVLMLGCGLIFAFSNTTKMASAETIAPSANGLSVTRSLNVGETYTVNFYNGTEGVGTFQISAGDSYTLTQTGYIINGVSTDFTGKDKMENCAYGTYYGSPIIDNTVVATFTGWKLNNSVLPDNGTWNTYTESILTVTAVWTPVNFTATFITGDKESFAQNFNYFDGITLPIPTKDGCEFLNWKDEDGTVYDGGDTINNRLQNITLTAQWSELYTVILKSTQHNTTYYREWTQPLGYQFTLPTLSYGNYQVVSWGSHEAGTTYTITGDAELIAVWGGKHYKIYYQNLTFDGKTADVLINYEIGNYAPTEYEYGVGLNLSNITAYWQADGPYSPHLKFLGWYTDDSFTTQKTSISSTNSGPVNLYAKWRYDKDNPSRSGTYTITDSGRFNQSYDQFTIGLAEYNDLVNIGIEYLAITLKINMWEVDEGYQYIFIYDGSGSNDTLLWETKITFGGSGKDTTPGVKEYQIYIPIDKLKDVQYLYIRYGASGAFGDTWRNDQIYLELMYVVDQNDIYDPEFNWSYQDPFD